VLCRPSTDDGEQVARDRGLAFGLARSLGPPLGMKQGSRSSPGAAVAQSSCPVAGVSGHEGRANLLSVSARRFASWANSYPIRAVQKTTWSNFSPSGV